VKLSIWFTTLLLMAAPAFAQSAAVDLNLTIASASGKAVPTLTWANPTAASCTATGDAAWVTAYNALGKPVSGTSTLAALSPPNARSYTLTCSFPGNTDAILTWTRPTTRTDGSPLTDLAGFKIYWNTGDVSLVTAPGGKLRTINDPTAVTTTVVGLAAGAWNFAAAAFDSALIDSDLSNIVNKTVTVASSFSKTLSLAFPGTTVLIAK
jgi:hypothetical protein